MQDRRHLLDIGAFAGVPIEVLVLFAGVKEAWIHGDRNLEQPALLSTQSIVVVDVALRKANSTGSTAAESVLQATVAIPLHARYPVCHHSHAVVSWIHDCFLNSIFILFYHCRKKMTLGRFLVLWTSGGAF